MNRLPDILLSLLPLLATTLAVIATLALMHWWLLARQPGLGKARQLPRQLALLGATIAGLVLMVVALPVVDSTRNQIITLIGLLLSGVIAFSSTTIVANLMAGLVLRLTQPFRTGDFIRVGDFFGRVTERGLFDTEIQTERRELVSLTNSYLLANPVSVILSSGTLISADVSLGYELHHARVRTLLRTAATQAGLTDPFVQVMELGDHAISYRVNGMLTEVKSLITARSRLNRAMLDALHGDGIEIVSPTFMNQRRLPADGSIIPAAPAQAQAQADIPARPEDIVFDKAEEASQRAQARHALKTAIRKIESTLKDTEGDAREAANQQIVALRAQLDELQQSPEEDEDAADSDEGSDSPALESTPAGSGQLASDDAETAVKPNGKDDTKAATAAPSSASPPNTPAKPDRAPNAV